MAASNKNLQDLWNRTERRDEMDKVATCIGYDEYDKPIYVLVEKEVHPMFMGYVDGEEVWTESS